ncbi:MAG: sodium:proton antiporter [Cyanobacteria bacterium P01_G01_bin.19]
MLDSLLYSLVLILLGGFVGGQVSRRLGAPPLLGMMVAGIFLGTEGGNLIGSEMLSLADSLRSIAVTIILMRAGLGLDRSKLVKQGSVALRLGFLPAMTEAIAVAILSMWLFEFDWLTGLLLGCIIGAESPAVIVPGMLRLKNLGWGVSKGIADAILTGSALSDVVILLLFSLLLNFFAQGEVSNSQLWLLPVTATFQILFGVAIGYIAAKLIVFSTVKQKWTQNRIQNTLITTCFALVLVAGAEFYPYFSGYLAVMAMGFFLIQFSPPLARILRQEFNHLWIVAEIVLFVLMGATIQLQVLEHVLLPGLILLASGLLLGRTIGWYLATFGSNWTWKEKLFLLPGNSAKATVQAAIGAIPLSLGIPGGDVILAIAALSILVTAPIGAWAIPTFAPKLLTRGKVDPTIASSIVPTVILGIVDANRENAIAVAEKVASLARRSNGEAVIAYLSRDLPESLHQLKPSVEKSLLDIPTKFISIGEQSERQIYEIVEKYQVTEIFVARQSRALSQRNTTNLMLDSIANNTKIPVFWLPKSDSS